MVVTFFIFSYFETFHWFLRKLGVVYLWHVNENRFVFNSRWNYLVYFIS